MGRFGLFSSLNHPAAKRRSTHPEIDPSSRMRPTRRPGQPVFLSKSSVASDYYSLRFALLSRLIRMLQEIRHGDRREDSANKASHAWSEDKTKAQSSRHPRRRAPRTCRQISDGSLQTLASGFLNNFPAARRFFVFGKRRAQRSSHPILSY